jgi:ADP-ribose pyrophosphatase
MFQPWQILARRLLLEREPWLSIWEEDVALPNGQRIPGYLRAQARDFAMVFAVLDDGTVPLVQQYKQGIGGPSYDLPAGYLNSPDETPLAAARRELREETGLVADEWKVLGHFVIDSNRGDTRAHCYLATGVHAGGEQELDATEALVVSYQPVAALRAMVLNGTIDSVASVAGIMTALQVLQSAASPH